MVNNTFYENTHLIVAAIRIIEHTHGTPPTIVQICQTLNFSLEKGNQLCRKLGALDIIEIMDAAGDTRIFIKDHLKIEEIQDQPEPIDMESELLKFKKSQKKHQKKIDTIKAEQAEKKKKLHSELEEKLKKVLKK